MSDYIKREDAKQLFLSHMGNEFPQSIKEQIVEKAFEELSSSADVVEVRHGRWEDLEQHSWSVNLACKCQICGWLVNYTQSKAFAYCPNCGAKMDGEEQEHEALHNKV